MKTTTFFKTMLAAAILSLGSMNVGAQGSSIPLVSYEAENWTGGTVGDPTYATDVSGDKLSKVGFTTNPTTAACFPVSGWNEKNAATVTNAADATSYVTFSIQAAVNCNIDVDSLTIVVWGSNTAPKYGYFGYKVDDADWVSNPTKFEFGSTANADPIKLENLNIKTAQKVEFRFWAVDDGTSASSIGGTGNVASGGVLRVPGNNTSMSDLVVYGKVNRLVACTDPEIGFSEPSIVKKTSDAPFTVVANTVSDGTVIYSSDNADVASVNESSGEVTLGHAGTAKITASVAATATYCAGTADYTIEVLPGGTTKTYKIVTSNADLIDGGKYLIVGKRAEEYYAMGWQNTNNRPGVKVTVVEDKIEVEPASIIFANDSYYPYEITLEQATQSWYLKDELNNGEYLRCAGGNTDISRLFLDASAIEYQINIFTVDSIADIICTGMDGSNAMDTIRFNSAINSLLFNSYRAGAQSPVYLYKYDDGTTATPEISTTNITILQGKGYIDVQLTESNDISIIAASGVTLSVKAGTPGSNVINLPVGVYIIKVGNITQKLLVY
ncbi:MAG: T9SS type A sorting domain-containing protein [Prevotellaceae bacterium]|jgi:hypothetical protein|nr:T9SS type A sorting domain-containing protein [Prevotellaceae bacterium]